MSRLETGFRDVDAAGDAESYADYLSHVNGLESVAAASGSGYTCSVCVPARA